jgi:hypothetical protein
MTHDDRPQSANERMLDEAFCGSDPLSRTAAGSLAETKHGNCTTCWMPVPLTSLVDDTCSDCRGEAPSFKRFDAPPSRGDYI